jgi:hypothetical protein
MPHPIEKNPKILKIHNKFGVNAMKRKKDTYWSLGIRVQVQQQRSMIMTMKNIIHKLSTMNKITSHQTQKHNNLLFHY